MTPMGTVTFTRHRGKSGTAVPESDCPLSSL
jgi:hypothetical protein